MEKVSYVQWTDISMDNSTKSRGTQILRMKTGQTYRIRPLCTPVRFKRFYRWIDGRWNTAITKEGIEDAMPNNVRVSKRFAFYVIDRADGGIKIVEVPYTVLRSIQTSAALSGTKPDDLESGSDFAIRVSGTGVQTQYYSVRVGGTPLTDSEKTAVAATDMHGTLEAIYRSLTLDEVREQLKAYK